MASILNLMVAWNCGDDAPYSRTLGFDKPGTIKVGPWPDRTGWSEAYGMTEGACESEYHEFTPEERAARVFMLFNKLVIRDKMDPLVVHEAFLAIDEYKDRLSIDTPGAS